jgi:hypothetical protein
MSFLNKRINYKEKGKEEEEEKMLFTKFYI